MIYALLAKIPFCLLMVILSFRFDKIISYTSPIFHVIHIITWLYMVHLAKDELAKETSLELRYMYAQAEPLLSRWYIIVGIMCCRSFRDFLLIHTPIYIIGAVALELQYKKVTQDEEMSFSRYAIRFTIYYTMQASLYVIAAWFEIDREITLFFQNCNLDRNVSDMKEVMQAQNDFLCIIEQDKKKRKPPAE